MAQTVLITGASRGIGRATARLFADRGWQVAVNYRQSAQAAAELCAELCRAGGRAVPIRADVSVRADVERMIAQADELFGGVDVLVNNAGIAGQKLFTDITDEEWNRMVAVDLTGVFYCCQAVLPHMIHQKSGRIINLSSMWGVTGGSCEVHYSAVKAGVIGLTKALAKELGPSNIRVNCVAPGVIGTEMNAALSEDDMAALKEETPLMRLGTPRDVAEAIYFLAGEGGSFFTGQVLSPNGGFVI